MPKISKSTKFARARSLIAGVTKHLSTQKTFLLRGEVQSAEALVALFQSQIDALNKITAAHVALRVAVGEEQAIATRALPIEASLKVMMGTRFGWTSATYRDFGWAPPKKTGPKTAAAKVAGAEKARATRIARGTMGPKQRKRSEKARSRV